MKQQYSVAIDGPSGAGKSTLARAVAKELGILYVDTGAIYRTIGCAVRARGLDPKDAGDVIPLLPQLDIRMEHGADGLQHMFLNGEDVTQTIRLPEMSMYASDVSAMPAVRAYLLEMQRDMARRTSVIMDGRDIGTVVLPDADVKIYLTANSEARAERRCRELAERGTPKPYEEVLREINARDAQDMSRAAAPLRAAEDAVRVDTSALDFDASRELLLALIRERIA